MSIKISKNLVLENKVMNLLKTNANDCYSRDVMAPHVAKISLMMNHLYQDLGFDNRIQMASFMKKHFSSLAEKKPKEKLWKKFIFDSIGEVAPACATCETQANCFACKV